MRNSLAGFAVLFLLPGLAVAAADSHASPHIAFQQTRQDAGAVPQGQSIRSVFPFENKGTAVLKILDVKTSCGCTIPRFETSIEPGRAGTLELAIDTKNLRGAVSKSAIVISNDPARPQIVLTVDVRITEPVTVEPPGFFRFNVLEGTAESAEAVLASSDPAFQIRSAEPPESYYDAVVNEMPGAPPGMKRYKVTVSISSDAPNGVIGGTVNVKTSLKTQPEIKIALTGVVSPQVAVTPSFVNFQNFQFLGHPVQRRISVVNRDPKDPDFRVVKAEVKGARIAADVKAVDKGGFDIVLTVDPKIGRGEFEGTVVISTTNARWKEIRIPVQGLVFDKQDFVKDK